MILEPVQNAGGCFTPPEGYFQRVREICDEYDVLLISDEVICSWGRLGEWFGAERYGYQPDIITTAKGITSRLRADGRDDRLRPRRRAVPRGHDSFVHGFTFGGHPIASAVALANIDVVRGGGHPRERPRERGRASARCSTRCATSRSSATCAAPGYFHAIELVKDRDTKETSPTRSPRRCCAASSRGELFRRGLICRADDRGDPVIQLSPPLIAGPEQFEEIEAILRPVLEEASARVGA